jgi:hypothetical protein
MKTSGFWLIGVVTSKKTPFTKIPKSWGAWNSGSAVGAETRAGIGCRVGAGTGCRVGAGTGCRVGAGTGCRVGAGTGCRVGARTGCRVGARTGCRVGAGAGARVDAGTGAGVGSAMPPTRRISSSTAGSIGIPLTRFNEATKKEKVGSFRIKAPIVGCIAAAFFDPLPLPLFVSDVSC